MKTMNLPEDVSNLLHSGTVIPAHPLALTADLKIDEFRQRRLTRYYIASGAGGVAVGVHTTQFEIRDPRFHLYEPVISIAAEEIDKANVNRPFIKVAGICGPTKQAIGEAKLAVKYGYHLGLLSMGGLNNYSEDDLITRVKEIAAIIPVFGFYLQPAVGGRVFTYNFWQQFAAIENVQAIKVAAFNRYQSLDVVRAVCNSPRAAEIALYTGNDDNIVADLLTPYQFVVKGVVVKKYFVGGLLGHWSVWTSKAVELFNEIKGCRNAVSEQVMALLGKGVVVTDMNAAIFDPGNAFKGSIAGIHEVLRRQGLMNGTWCLNPAEILSPGQSEEIGRVVHGHSVFTDDEFVSRFLADDHRDS
jgi:hypothetical protein